MGQILTNSDFLDYHDWRWVSKNLLDTNPATAAQLADLLDESSPAGSRLARFITRAEEMLFAACVVGDRYAPADVILYGGELAKGIVADLAIGPVLTRRDRAASDQQALSLAYSAAMDYLEQLRRGERVFFAVPDVPQAGLPGTTTMLPTPGVNPMLITQRAVRYFGVELNPSVYGSTFPPPG